MPFWRRREKTSRDVAQIGRKAIESLESIATKKDIDVSEIIQSVSKAWDKGESQCGQLTVKCREKSEDSAIFLFTDENEVVAQFPISMNIIQRSSWHGKSQDIRWSYH